MLKEFIEHIQKTTQPLITTVNGSTFCVTSDGNTEELLPTIFHPYTLDLNSLDALVTMVRTEASEMDAPLYIAVPDCKTVRCFGQSRDYDERCFRQVYYEAHATDVPGWDQKVTLGFEEAQIALRTRFQETPDTLYAMKLVSDISLGAKVIYNDNGIATTITTQKGVALQTNEQIRPLVKLRPYVKTFDGTVVGMEKTAAFLNNLPFCLDELQLAKDSKGRTTFDVYKLAQGVGRTRGNRAGGVDLTPTWRNCILTTGESPLTGTASGAGAVNRVIDIECKSAQAVIRDGMRISGAVKRNYGFAGRKFVERLYQPSVIDQVSERYRELFRILSDRDTTEKQAMAAAAIILADELACQWIFGGTQQPLTIEQVSEFLASKAAVSAGDRGYKYLCDWVTQNSNKLCGRSENPNIEVLGALEDGRAYIIRSVFERILQDAGYSTAAMISYLKQSNLIETRGRANTKGKRINGIPTECFCLRLPSVELDDEADPDEQPL